MKIDAHDSVFDAYAPSFRKRDLPAVSLAKAGTLSGTRGKIGRVDRSWVLGLASGDPGMTVFDFIINDT